MPGLPMPCLNTIQPIFGSDIHLSIPPPPPALPVPMPHAVVWVVGLSQKMNFLGFSARTSKALSPESNVARPVTACWGYTVARGHDSGPHPSHIFPNALFPQIMSGSSSKAEFAAGTVHTQNGRLAVGACWLVNPQLQCGVIPLPSGCAIVVANTVKAGFTWSDFWCGVVYMSFDSAVTWLIGKALGLLTHAGLWLIGKLAGLVKLNIFAKWLVGGFVPGDKTRLSLAYRGRTSTTWKTLWILKPSWVRDFKNVTNNYEAMALQYLKSPSAIEGLLATGFGFRIGSPMGTSQVHSYWTDHAEKPSIAFIDGLFYD